MSKDTNCQISSILRYTLKYSFLIQNKSWKIIPGTELLLVKKLKLSIDVTLRHFIWSTYRNDICSNTFGKVVLAQGYIFAIMIYGFIDIEKLNLFLC